MAGSYCSLSFIQHLCVILVIYRGDGHRFTQLFFFLIHWHGNLLWYSWVRFLTLWGTIFYTHVDKGLLLQNIRFWTVYNATPGLISRSPTLTNNGATPSNSTNLCDANRSAGCTFDRIRHCRFSGKHYLGIELVPELVFGTDVVGRSCHLHAPNEIDTLSFFLKDSVGCQMVTHSVTS